MAARPAPKQVDDWETVSAPKGGADDWETVSGPAPAGGGLTPPPMPKAPIPPGLQGPPATQTGGYWGNSFANAGQDILGAQQRGTLRDQLLRDAQPLARSAELTWGVGAGPGELAATVRGAGRAAGFAAKYLPFSKFSQAGEATEGALGSLAQRVAKNVPQLPETPLPQQAARVAQRFGRATSGRSVGAARPPRPDLIEQMGGRPVEDISDQALKQQMENSPEVSYGQYAKRHAGPTSRSYPEPNPNDPYWREQSPNLAPWGGKFSRQ